MKKLALITLLTVLLTGCCLSQMPTQYAYVDENCTAVLPDFVPRVIVSDNCEIAQLTQLPSPGQPITATTVVSIVAIDNAGNESEMSFDVVLLDTVAPTMTLDPNWIGYTDKEVMQMYKVFYGWVQEKGDYFNEFVAGTEGIIELPDTTIYYIEDSMKIFYGTIPILEYRIDEGYWSGITPDLTHAFK